MNLSGQSRVSMPCKSKVLMDPSYHSYNRELRTEKQGSSVTAMCQ